MNTTLFLVDHLNHLFHYHHELSIANHYFQISNISLHLENLYFNEFRNCFLPNDEISMDRRNRRKCLNHTNTQSFAHTRLWRLPMEANLPPSIDCEYQISLQSIQLIKEHDYLFHLHILQLNCQSEFYTFLGGTTFHTLAYNSYHLITCQVIDHFNMNYDLLCTLKDLDKLKESNSQKCMKLTVLVDFEHYDGFSEGLPGTNSDFPMYNGLRHIIIDDQEYCSNVVSMLITNPVSSPNWPNKSNISNHIQVYGGLWLVNQTGTIFMNSLIHRKFLSAWDFRQLMNSTSAISSGHIDDSDINLYPSILRQYQNTIEFGNKYDFYPLGYTSSTSNSNGNGIGNGNGNGNGNGIGNSNGNSYSDSNTRESLKKDWNIKNITNNQYMNYHFIGASHMRYNFDVVVDLFLGEHALDPLESHHGDAIIKNLHNYHSILDYNTVLAEYQAELLENQICNPHVLNYNKEMTIIFQTGSWDLTNAPLRRPLRDSHVSLKLVETIARILNGSILCPGLRHFVFMTTVPHSICFDGSEGYCNSRRGYRTNSAIAALNQFYLQHLLLMKPKFDLKLSIIDAYSIILPRLMLHPDSEQICLCHYHCRVRMNPIKTHNKHDKHDKHDKHNKHEKDILGLAHTKGGDAVVHSLLLALSQDINNII